MKAKALSIIASLALAAISPANVDAQMKNGNSDVHDMSAEYVYPSDPAVQKKLEDFRDRKFGIFFHWGLYSVPGIPESWPLCQEDRFSARRAASAPRKDMSYREYKDWYWGLANEFNPTEFDPAAWAKIAKDGGMKYMVFTTKHHDGFNMFDTKLSDFSIAKGPFAENPKKDVAKEVFKAFRDQDFMIGCYFSKPDWHCPYFWKPGVDTPTRGLNYDYREDPETLKKFADFTHGQIVDELMSRYGSIDILWLDGGWVRKGKIDINIDKIVDDARAKQPGLIAVDRTIHGRNENYRTPEMTIPKEQMTEPWETCLVLGESWSWRPGANYHSSHATLQTLFEVVAKGGNLLLGVGPDGKGRIDPEAAAVLKQVGKWLDKNGEAIYGTRPVPNYHQGNIWFTGSKDGKTMFAIYTDPNEYQRIAKTISWTGNEPVGPIIDLASGTKLNYKTVDNVTTVTLPRLFNEPIALKFNVKSE